MDLILEVNQLIQRLPAFIRVAIPIALALLVFLLSTVAGEVIGRAIYYLVK